MNITESLLIESYALGYLAQQLDRYVPSSYPENDPQPIHDNCFVALMSRHNIVSIVSDVILATNSEEFSRCVDSYCLGYKDSELGARSKVVIPNPHTGHKVWMHTVDIVKLLPLNV